MFRRKKINMYYRVLRIAKEFLVVIDKLSPYLQSGFNNNLYYR